MEDTIHNFGCVVDAIENSEFSPPTVQELNKTEKGSSQKFGTRICRNCDARFSCDSFYEWKKSKLD